MIKYHITSTSIENQVIRHKKAVNAYRLSSPEGKGTQYIPLPHAKGRCHMAGEWMPSAYVLANGSYALSSVAWYLLLNQLLADTLP
jgi:hypothetical protein